MKFGCSPADAWTEERHKRRSSPRADTRSGSKNNYTLKAYTKGGEKVNDEM